MDPLPRRLLFIASIGNKPPYHRTRHSAGHLLLDAVKPLLQTTLPNTGLYHETWHSPTYMNESGPKLVRRLEQWATERHDRLARIATVASTRAAASTSPTPPDLLTPTTYPTTLIILHDELESPLGKVRVKRGGPEAFSLRGHRGLISICETLRGKGLHPPRSYATYPVNGDRKPGSSKSVSGPLADLSILRVGVGIGRPTSREKNAVSDYVLKPVSEIELKAYQAAAGPVVDVIRDELFRPAGKI
ncbi:Peptidyl-tRNA hydrolase [Penicillium sp. IBT 31633x]|nr:Peptidyl-tRNA hydrolase [Penicillium sp. IBT 31633x]